MKPFLCCTALVLTGSLASAQTSRLPPVPYPAGNQHSADKAALGKALFYEEQMSATNTVSCATCHAHERGGSDPRSLGADSLNPGRDGIFNTRDDIRGSRGVIGNNRDGSYRATQHFGLRDQVTGRRAMTVINAAYSPQTFWDGRGENTFRDPLTNNIVLQRRGALESQAVNPPVSDVEMAHFGQTWSDVTARLAAAKPLALASNIPAALATFIGNNGYPELFRKAFGDTQITPVRIAFAIATYERTLISDQSRVDQFLGGNRRALTQQEQRGRQIFTNRQNACSSCHGGGLQTDNRFHYTGVTPQDEDLGRFLVTRENQDRGRQRTPTVRNVELRAPFFHNGSARTLREVVDFYARGGDFFARNKDRRIRRLNLSNGARNDLVAFLIAFTDDRVRRNLPPFDRPTLYTESNNVPVSFGAGTAGSGGVVPRAVAVEPAMIGNPRMTVGMERGYGGSPALLMLDTVPSRSGIPILGINLHVGLSPTFMLFPAVALRGSGEGAGWTSHVMPVPNEPGLRGVHLFGQYAILDMGRRQFSATEGVDIPIF